MNFLLRWLANGLAVLLTAYLIPGVDITAPAWALLIAIVLMALNVLVKPIFIIITLPLTLLTFGLFLLVINAVVVMLAGVLIPGFVVSSFWAALGFSIVLTIIQTIFTLLAEQRVQ